MSIPAKQVTDQTTQSEGGGGIFRRRSVTCMSSAAKRVTAQTTQSVGTEGTVRGRTVTCRGIEGEGNDRRKALARGISNEGTYRRARSREGQKEKMAVGGRNEGGGIATESSQGVDKATEVH